MDVRFQPTVWIRRVASYSIGFDRVKHFEIVYVINDHWLRLVELVQHYSHPRQEIAGAECCIMFP